MKNLSAFLVSISLLLCSVAYSQTVCEVLPSFSFDPIPSTVCINEPSFNLTGAPPGGSFSGPGVTGNTFDPSSAGGGTHDIIYSLTTYGMDTSGTYNPVTGSGTSLNLFDDQEFGPISLGFSFDFFGVSYTDVYVSSNGWLSFQQNFTSGCCSGQFLPDNFTPNNLIAFAWDDLYPPGNGTVEYFTTGTAPNRKFVLEFDSIPQCCGSTPIVTMQLILYETTNEIEIHTGSTGPMFNTTMGLENAAGDLAVVVPGRNSEFWSATNDFVRFIPDACVFADTQSITVDTTPAILDLSVPCLHFDTLFVNASQTDTVTIINPGCDTLDVTNISSSLSNYTTNITSFTLPPADTIEVAVTFSPSAVGSFPDSLHFTSNVGTEAICLTGFGTAAPELLLVPESISITLNGCDEIDSTVIAVINVGAADLEFEFDLDPGTPIPAICTPFTNSHCCSMGILNFTFGSINNSSGNGFFSTQDFSDSIFTYLNPASSNNVSVQTGPTYNENVRIWIDWDNDGDFSTGEMVFESLNLKFHSGSIVVPPGAVTNTALRLRVASDYSFSSVPEPCQNVTYGQFEDYTVFIAPGLSLSPVADTVAPGDTTFITAVFDGTGLAAGNYDFAIDLETNDPLAPNDSVPVYLTLNGLPEADVSDLCIAMDTTVQFSTSTDTFLIYNEGCDTLVVSSLTTTLADFDTDTSSLKVPPADSAEVVVFFNPQTPGSFTDTVQILTNDIDTFICLTGFATGAPLVDVTPDSIGVTVPCFDSTTVSLTIENIGLADLTYSISGAGGGQSLTPKVLLLSQSGNPFSVETELINTGKFTGSDIEILQSPSVVTMADLDTFDVVLVWGNNTFNNATNVGDTLKAYVDQGGAVIISTYSLTTNWQLSGGIFDADYCPFLPGATTCVGGAMDMGSISDPTHPVFDSINVAPSYWWNCNYSNPSLNAGAQLLATDNQGNNLIAENSNGKVMGIAIYPGNLSSGNFETSLLFANAIYYAYNPGSAWITVNPGQDTITAGDSTVVTFDINAGTLQAGTYEQDLTISTNDPTKPTVIVPVTLTVSGTAVIEFDSACLEVDSTIELSSSTDTLWIYNTGCDTLIATSITTNTSYFSPNISGGYLVAGDTGYIIISFSPDSVGTFLDTVSFVTNVGDTQVCLTGYGLPRPQADYLPDTLTATINSCCDSVIVPLTIYNVGAGILDWTMARLDHNVDDFDSGISSELWSSTTGIASTACGSVNGDALYFTDNSFRHATTAPMDLGDSGIISFYLKIANGSSSPCESADSGEDVTLEYSSNGGVNWIVLNTYNEANYPSFTFISESVPQFALGPGMMYRWHQASHSGSCCDHWAIDEVTITGYATSGIDSTSGTIGAGDSAIVDITAISCDLLSGVHQFDFILSTNDPLNPVDTIPAFLTVNGTPELGISDSCLTMDTAMQWTDVSDTIWVYNDGCDTLIVTSITNNLSIFEPDTTSFSVPPEDSMMVIVEFSPVAPGSFFDTLTIFSNDIDTTICLFGVGIGAPVIEVSPDSFDLTVPCFDSTTVNLTISNASGIGTLDFEISGDTTEVLALMYGVDNFTEGPNTINAVEQNFDLVNITEINTTDSNTLDSALQTVDVLLIPEREFASTSVFTDFANVLNEFCN